MTRKRYLVCYDIRSPGRLRRVAKLMESYGERVQYSVFVADLSVSERRDLQMRLREIVHPADSIMFVSLGEGYSTSGFEYMGRRPDFPTDGPIIV